MKKKFKLFATIGSLALAICMMTIGVLAATTVQFTVNSSVQFQVGDDLLLDMAVATTSSGSTALAGSDAASQSTYTGDGSTGRTPTATTEYTAQAQTATFNAVNDTVTYTITFTNHAEFDVTVTVEALPTAVTKDGKTLTSVISTYGAESTSVAQDGTFTIPAATNEATPGTVTHTVTIKLLRTDTSFNSTDGAVTIVYSATKAAD